MKELNFKEWLLNQKDGVLKIDKNSLLEHLKKDDPDIMNKGKISSERIREALKHNETIEPITIDCNFNIIDGLYRFLAMCEVGEIKEIEVNLLPSNNLILNLSVGNESESLIYDPETETLTVKRDNTGIVEQLDKQHRPEFSEENEKKLLKAMKDLKDIFDSADDEEEEEEK